MNIRPAGLLLTATLCCPVVAGAAAPSVEVGFSPEGSAERLILRTLDEAHSSIRLMGYSFTSPEIVRALIAARKRGVDVRVVVDEKGNRGKASQAALSVVIKAGIPLRVNDNYLIMHDKIIVTDDVNVEVGSFNYTRSAARSNSENALVIRDAPELARTYLQHWQSRWDGGTDWHPLW